MREIRERMTCMPSTSPTVSVIVPVYRASAFIAQCAESLLSQSYSDIEYVFVNDGTTDDSIYKLQQVLERHPERAVKAQILHQENRGVQEARKAGLMHISGDCVIQLDADDWVEPELVEKLVGKMLETQADLVYCDYYLEYPDHSEIAEEQVYTDRKELLKDLYNGKRFHGYFWNKLVRRSLYEAVTVWPQYSMRDDLVVVSQLVSHAKQIAHMGVPLYHYRLGNSGSVSNSKIAKQKFESARNLMLLYDFYRRSGKSDAPGSPVSGVEEDLLQRICWFALAAKDFGLYRDYPYFRKELIRISPARTHDLSLWKQWAMRIVSIVLCVK